MHKGYVFLLNGNKPTQTERMDRSPVLPSQYSAPWIRVAQSYGFRTFLGVNRADPSGLEVQMDGVALYDSSTYRSLFDLRSNIRALRNLLSLIRDSNIEVIHCNTPIGGLIGRIAGRIGGVSTVIYSAHGFHFYEGNTRLRNAVYRTVEKFLARWTDAIITINSEDFAAAKTFQLRRKNSVFQINGVGINREPYIHVSEKSRIGTREAIGIGAESIVIVAIGDLQAGKGFADLIRSMAHLKHADLHLLICGSGPQRAALLSIADELEVGERVHLLGFRSDIPEILAASDIFAHVSSREGLPRVVMEAMAAGLPLVLSDIRGHRDIVERGGAAYLVPVGSSSEIAGRLQTLSTSRTMRQEMGKTNADVSVIFDIEVVNEQIEIIYDDILGGLQDGQ